MFSRANGLIVLYTYIYCLASTLIFSFFIHVAKLDIRSLSFDNKEEEILVLILISPLIEVYFFQKLIIDFLVNKKINWFIDIIVSSLLFGIAHSSTPIQFAKGFINGYLKLKKIVVTLLQGFL